MPSAASDQSASFAWHVTRPLGPSTVSGVRMAGFRDAGSGMVDLRAVAHPAVMLAFEFGDSSLVVEDPNGRERRGSVVVGLAPGAVRVRGDLIEALQVRLSPLVAHAVFGASQAALSGQVVDTDELWGGDAARIREQLAGASSWQERFAVVDAMLARRYHAGPAADAEVAWAWHRMVTSRGSVRVESLADELGWSRKRLWSRFQTQVGLTPKRAAMLVRFDDAAHRLAAGRAAAAVAADAGYVDQSHLHRDVVAFGGVTPTAIAAEPWLAVDAIAWPA
jgi:AraC-like DNA-binding protein